MNAADLKRRLEAWPTAAGAAIGSTLEAAAAEIATEARRHRGPASMGGGPVAVGIEVGRDPEGRTTIAANGSDAVTREYGSGRRAARPYLRPAVAAVGAGLRGRLASALREAFPSRGAR